MTARIILGTAQFGTAYGITNEAGRLADEVVEDVIRASIRLGVVTLDTAFAYGDAEVRVGDAVKRLGGRFRAITKFSLLDVKTDGLGAFLWNSRQRLRCDRLDILLHRPADIAEIGFGAILDELRTARAGGVVTSFGASVYDATELEVVVEAMPDLDLVQVPGSIVDRRMLDLPLLAELAERGVEVHVRSLFLQGLLLASPGTLAPQFEALEPVLSEIDDYAARLSTSRIAVLVGAVLGNPVVGGIVVGTTSAEELREIVNAAATEIRPNMRLRMFPEALLDPRRWVR